MTEIKISTETIKDDFKLQLDIESNSRIFFSGKFGMGKTYFLKEFFDLNKKDYEVFHLYPINYQISVNEDVLELIKYDLFIELINKNNYVLKGNKINGVKESFLFFYAWLENKVSVNSFLRSTITIGESALELSLDPVSKAFSKLGRPMKDFLELDKEYQEFKSKYEAGEKGEVEEYLKSVKKNNLNETDYLSSLLKDKIEEVKNKKKSVLILDDLDRMDPEHIFRILNVLSSYFDRECENKFGFDKIIIVADYSNLEHMFHHKYGAESNFSGYMDKFFSISPYHFSNKKSVLDAVDQICKAIRNEEPTLASAISTSGYIKIFLEYIFTHAVLSGKINLRELLKITKHSLPEFRKGSYFQDQFGDDFKIIFDKSVMVLIKVFSSSETLIKKLEQLKKIKTNDTPTFPYSKYILSMLNYMGYYKISGLGVETNFYYKDYNIRVDTGGRTVSVAGADNKNLFYDALIDYVKSDNNFSD